MIQVNNLTKYFGAFAAIQDVSFEVEAGEIVGFLGPNGAGKSTTMRILTGFSPASRGTAHIDGYEVHLEPLEVKRRVGYLPERVPLYDEMTVKGFLSYIAEIKGMRRRARLVESERVMERCGLGHMANRIVGNLSKGYRQRVGLAQALVGSPKVLVLDEPTVGLDPEQIVEIRKMIKGLREYHTVLISTHILPEVSMLCQRVLIINQGHIVAQDSMENLAGFGRAQQLLVKVAANGDKALHTLRTTPGVAEVREETPNVFSVRGNEKASAGRELNAALAQALVQAQVPLVSLEERARTLEEIFVEVVSKERETLPPTGDAISAQQETAGESNA